MGVLRDRGRLERRVQGVPFTPGLLLLFWDAFWWDMRFDGTLFFHFTIMTGICAVHFDSFVYGQIAGTVFDVFWGRCLVFGLDDLRLFFGVDGVFWNSRTI